MKIKQLILIAFVGICWIPTSLYAQSESEIIENQAEKAKCFQSKKKKKERLIKVPDLSLMFTKEIILSNENDPLNSINGIEGFKLRHILFEYWKNEVFDKNDSTNSVKVDFETHTVSYLIDKVESKTVKEVVSITLQVKDDKGAEYATLIFCLQDVKAILQSNSVMFDGKKLTIWEYIQNELFTSKDLYLVKLEKDSFPCYFK